MMPATLNSHWGECQGTNENLWETKLILGLLTDEPRGNVAWGGGELEDPPLGHHLPH